MINAYLINCKLRWSDATGKLNLFNLRVLPVFLIGIALVSNDGKGLVAQTIAITNAKIIPIVGDPIEEGSIVIRDGKIAAIGTDVRIPVEARVIDAKGKVIVPGFVEVHSSDGMSQANENNPNVPYLSVLDTVDPRRGYFDEARRNGVTTVSVVPANSTMIGGQGAVLKTGETFLDAMILQRVSGMKLSLSPASGANRMGQLAALKKELADAYKLAFPASEKSSDVTDPTSAEVPANGQTDAPSGENGDPQRGRRGRSGQRPQEDRPINGDNGQKERPIGDGDDDKPVDETKKEAAKVDSKDEKKPTPIDELKQPMVDLVSGKMLAYIHCETPMDVKHALELIEEFKLKPILVLGRACYKAAEEISASGYPVVLDSDLVFWERDPRTNSDRQVVAIDRFKDLLAPIAFSVGRTGGDTVGKSYLWYQAATAVKYGMDRQRALQALTIEPAKMLGVDEFVGSLEVGKDGDLLVLSGDPLNVDTWVDFTIINGKVVYDRTDDPKLQLLLEGKQ